MFKLSFYRVSYTYDVSMKFKRFKLFNIILSFLMNPMEGNKLYIKTSYLKVKLILVTHYLITQILFLKQVNFELIVIEDLVPSWLITQKFQTNLITKILATAGDDNMEETIYQIHSKRSTNPL